MRHSLVVPIRRVPSVLLFLQPDDWLGVSMTASPRVGQRAASNPPVKADAARTGKPVELRLRPYSVEERVSVNIKLVWEVWHNRGPLSIRYHQSVQIVNIGRGVSTVNGRAICLDALGHGWFTLCG
jgi:hypothetical protein